MRKMILMMGIIAISMLFLMGCGDGDTEVTTPDDVDTTVDDSKVAPPSGQVQDDVKNTVPDAPKDVPKDVPITKDDKNTEPVVKDISGLEGKTCAEQKGNECDITQECSGTWVDAIDSFSCCSGTCTGEYDELVIDDFGQTESDDGLGELV